MRYSDGMVIVYAMLLDKYVVYVKVSMNMINRKWAMGESCRSAKGGSVSYLAKLRALAIADLPGTRSFQSDPPTPGTSGGRPL